PRLAAALRDRYGYDVEATTAPIDGEPQATFVVAQYVAALVALHHAHDTPRALEHFAAASAAADARYARHGVYADAETPLLQAHALGERALLLAETDREAVPRALAALDDAVAQGAGSVALAAEYRHRVAQVRAAHSIRGRARRAAGAARRRV